MPIPVFKKTTADAVDHAGEVIDSSASTAKVLPPLAVISIANSALLRWFYRFFYALLSLSLCVAFIPYIGNVDSAVAVRLLWCLVLLCGCIGLWHLCARQCLTIPTGSLAYENGCWILSAQKERMSCVLVGEVLCWPWLIILLLEPDVGRKRFLLLASDAINPADQARLRTWLRACLKPKG